MSEETIPEDAWPKRRPKFTPAYLDRKLPLFDGPLFERPLFRWRRKKS